jgi:elongation factor 1-beta
MDFGALNTKLEDHSYVVGFVPTKADADTFAAMPTEPEAKYPHAARWWRQINSYSPAERAAWPTPSAPAPATAAPAPGKKPAAGAEDDFDLFESTEEDKAALEAERKRKAEELLRMAKEKGMGRSQIVLDVKPWDDETPMDKLEAAVRAIEIEGLTWGQSKLVAVGYGIKKLSIVAVVIDDLVSTDDIEEKITAISDYVQSMDVQSFNKL